MKKWLQWLRTKALPNPPMEANRFTGMLAGVPIPPGGWWREDSVEQIRNYQSWVYAAVNAIAQEMARHRPLVYHNLGQAEHEMQPVDYHHPLVQLLDGPNPWCTPWELWYLTMVYLELTGNCYWHLAARRDTGLPAEIWVIPTPWVKIVAHARHFISGYEVTPPGGQTTWFDAGEIVHLKYPSPHDPYVGLSPLQANALAIDANTELQRSRYQTFSAGQRPGIILQTDQLLAEPTIRRLEEKLLGKFSGRENWHRPMVLEQGLRASPWTLSPAEMDYLNSSRLSRDEIFAIYRVPLPIAGIVENMGLGSDIWFGARAMFCEGTIQPKLDLIAQVLTRDLARRFGADFAIQFADCSPRNQEQRRRDEELDLRFGLRTYNEIRQARGLPPYADAKFDQPIVPATVNR